MLIDSRSKFADKQAVTASAAGATIIDLKDARNIGVCCCLNLVVCCTADMTDAATDSTVTPSLRTSATAANSALTNTINTLATLPAFAAGSKAGTKVVAKLPPGDYLQYLDCYFTVAGGDLTTGKFSAFLVTDTDLQHFYPVGYTVS